MRYGILDCLHTISNHKTWFPPNYKQDGKHGSSHLPLQQDFSMHAFSLQALFIFHLQPCQLASCLRRLYVKIILWSFLRWETSVLSCFVCLLVGELIEIATLYASTFPYYIFSSTTLQLGKTIYKAI